MKSAEFPEFGLNRAELNRAIFSNVTEIVLSGTNRKSGLKKLFSLRETKISSNLKFPNVSYNLNFEQ